jgi:uncharacterized protein DUF6766
MKSSTRRFFRNNGLSLVLFGFFLVTYVVGQVFTGLRVHNEERAKHGEPALTFANYLASAHFVEATSENWESEFLQMFIYVYITAFLFQKGSAESNDPDKPQEIRKATAHSPWPVRWGGWWKKIYAHSLSLTLAGLFLVSFVVHCQSSTKLENEERLRTGLASASVWEHLHSAQFWFESFQNWQSEFLAIFSMVTLTIYLRERNSPESKAVEASHIETG